MIHSIKEKFIISKLMLDKRVRYYVRKLKKYDKRTYKHSLNVTYLVIKLLNLPPCAELFTKKEMKDIMVGALLHDIGKLNVPLNILNKSEQLKNNEFAVIKEHPVTGYQMAKEKGFPELVCDIIHEHHERRDGSGYPRRIVNFSKAVEIVYCADIYCAMTEERPYRKPSSESGTINIMYYDVQIGNINRVIFDMLKYVSIP